MDRTGQSSTWYVDQTVTADIDPEAVDVEDHSSRRRPPNMFSKIKIDAKDWSNLLRVSVVAKSMLACLPPYVLN